ncbi:MAG: FMN-binding glutamate synthase family protein [Cyanobacteria bacterium HKST-UBA04]|nr:FMN-binding glutamate synthase family protein [Cyanobacteria bacterium HKST-UBA04]MCA9840485.1 FMN-binding glutamate synthase family protein [Cyanobacteria bacterium HKST-UBA03]
MVAAALSVTCVAWAGTMNPWLWGGFIIVGPLVVLGIIDMAQKKQTIRRNFPLLGHGRYLMEMVRPGVNQYFVESNTDGRPFNRVVRSNIYQRAKQALNTVPFGTQYDVYEEGYEWINHSMNPIEASREEPKELIGGSECRQPYLASHFNISAMSYGALSDRAVLALNKGAGLGGFAHNTGEGGLSPYHLEHGGDIIWQLGTGYFGARDDAGNFSPERFAEKACLPSVKMIELKLSQGAKPGHGGILPAEKLTPEIARIRHVSMGQDVLSPPGHGAFQDPIGMMHFIATLRELSGGKPVGFKLCVGQKHEFFAVCKAMLETGILPDYIAVDGGEGGTGAAPLEFSNSVGTPLNEGLVFVHNALVGCNLRDQIRVFAGGKITTGFSMAAKLAMGADFCYSARGFMFALGCIQALECNSNTCPTGITTHNRDLVQGLVVEDKANRVANYHRNTIHSFMELLGAAGLTHPSQLQPWHILRRTSFNEVKNLGQIFHYLHPGELLGDDLPPLYKAPWVRARASSYEPSHA